MESITLGKDKLDILDEQVKFLINQGNWFLFEVSASSNPDICYLLVADTQFYTFDNNGGMVYTIDKRPTDIVYKKTVYFEGIPRPESLGSYRLAWAY